MRLECPKCEASVHVTGTPREDEIVRCPKCGGRFRAPPPDDDDDDRDEAPRRPARGQKKRKTRDGEGKKFPIGTAVAVVALLLVIGGVVTAIVLNQTGGNSKPNGPVAANSPDTKQSPQDQPPPFGGPGPGGPAQTPAEVADLFQARDGGGGAAAPTLSVPVLNRPDPSQESLLGVSVSRVDRTTGGGTGGPDGGKMSLDEIKKASVYIKVESAVGANTGSGFLIRADKGKGLIATNHHVIRRALASKETGGREGRVTVVFDSGLTTEVEHAAEVLAYDPAADLAVLRVSASKLPRPLDPQFAPAPVETLPVLICGFPLGELLASGKRSPAITIGKGSVSSLRRDDAGNIERIQIDGALNPGNSGGPIVDADGRLVGVAVTTIKPEFGSGIGWAVPAAELIAMLDGRILQPVFLPVESKAKNGEVEFRALVPVLDPLKQIKSVAIHVWTGDREPPRAAKDPATGWKLLPGAEKFEVPPAVRGVAMAELRLPLGKAGRPVVIQTAITTADGTVVSAPVRYDLKVGSVQTASDAIPLSIFAQNPDQYAGQVVSVRAVLPGVPLKNRWNYPELVVRDETDEEVSNVAFLTAHEIADQLQRLRPPGIDLPVRLTVRVGKPGPGGMTPVRVVRTDIIGRGDRLMLTIPPTDSADDQLAALNLNPEKFGGQSVQLEGQVFGRVFGTEQRPQLTVRTQAGIPVTNAQFTMSPTLAERFRAAGLNQADWHRVRMTATVAVSSSGNGPQAVVTVTKFELLGPSGQTTRKIE